MTGSPGRQHIAYFGYLRGAEDDKPAVALAGRLDLELDRPARALSKGNRQKLAVVLAVMSAPDLLVLDEPTSGLDPLVQQEFHAILREHTAEEPCLQDQQLAPSPPRVRPGLLQRHPRSAQVTGYDDPSPGWWLSSPSAEPRGDTAMARKVVVELTDDIDGGKAAETVTFGLDSRVYTIDLNAKNARALRKTLAPYVESGRRVRAGAPGRGRTRASAVQPRSNSQEVREWARSRGIQVADRGRIPTDLTAKFQAAHQS